MSSSIESVLSKIQQEQIKVVDLRFTNTDGKQQHLSLPSHQVNKSFFTEGKMFDGSSIGGWKSINESDMILMPDPNSALVDPFFAEPTLILNCDIVEPSTMLGYERDPRSLAKRAEDYLKSTGIADTFFVGPEPEFFVFEGISFHAEMHEAFYRIVSDEADNAHKKSMDDSNPGHRPGTKGGYFPVPPVDSGQDMRTTMVNLLEQMGLIVEAHHHEVAAGQHEIATKYSTLTDKADQIQTLKYVIHNVAHRYGKTATFMPKPLVGDNGSGMHCHQSLAKDGKNLFAGNKYAGLSELALYYIGGIIHHAKALNAFTNPSTNSYKRLVPGFEAPVLLAYSARNRSASIRIPHVANPQARRIEVRFPDPAANPYLAFSAMMLAGLDGIINQIHPGDAMDKDLYDLPPEELSQVPTVASSLEEALNALQNDHDFLTRSGVFSLDMINAYVKLKQAQIQRVSMTPHPVEFALYYSV